MAYVRPLVMVYQEFTNLGATAGTADLPCCIIGPAYHIVKAENDLNTSYAGDYTTVGLESSSFPNLKAGVTIESDSCSFLFKYVKGAVTDDPVSIKNTQMNEVYFTAETFPTKASVGDYAKITVETITKEEIQTPNSLSYILNDKVGTITGAPFTALAAAESIVVTLEDGTEIKSKATDAFNTATTREEILAAFNTAFSGTSKSKLVDQGFTIIHNMEVAGEDPDNTKFCIQVIRNDYIGDTNKNITKIDITDPTAKTALLTDNPTFTVVQEAVGETITNTSSSTEVVCENVKIIEINNTSYSLNLARTLAQDIITSENTKATIEITRELDDFTVNAKDDTDFIKVYPETSKFTLQPGYSHTYNTEEGSNTFKIVTAKVFPSYKGLRTDLCSKVYSINDSTQIETQLGEATSENPLAMGIKIAIANTTTTVYYVGVDSNDLQGYLNARAALSNAEPMYAIVPLTTEMEILTSYKTYAEQQSTPEVCKWCVVIGSTDITQEETKSEGTGIVKADFESKRTLFYAENATFMSDGIIPGNKLYIDGKSYAINKVTSEDTLSFSEEFSADLDGTLSYKVIASLTKDEQAQYIADISSGFKSYRYINVFPGKCIIEGEVLPGYYLACAIGGMTAGLSPHQGFTFISIAGISGVTGSWDYFTAEQLDVIAGGGTFILVQENEDMAPYVRHQLTTDMSSTDFSEFSSIKNFDYICYFISDGIDIYLGQYNITADTLELIKSFINTRLSSLLSDSLPKIGSPITAYDPATVEQDPDYKNGVIASCSVVLPNALNRIIIKIARS